MVAGIFIHDPSNEQSRRTSNVDPHRSVNDLISELPAFILRIPQLIFNLTKNNTDQTGLRKSRPK